MGELHAMLTTSFFKKLFKNKKIAYVYRTSCVFEFKLQRFTRFGTLGNQAEPLPASLTLSAVAVMTLTLKGSSENSQELLTIIIFILLTYQLVYLCT